MRPGHRGDGDNSSAALFQHDLAHPLAGKEGSGEIDRQRSLPDSGVHLLCRRRFFRDASRRDQAIDACGRRQHLRDGSIDAVRVRDVHRQVLPNRRLGTPPVQVEDLKSDVGEMARHRLAYAACRTGHYCDRSPQSAGHLTPAGAKEVSGCDHPSGLVVTRCPVRLASMIARLMRWSWQPSASG